MPKKKLKYVLATEADKEILAKYKELEKMMGLRLVGLRLRRGLGMLGFWKVLEMEGRLIILFR